MLLNTIKPNFFLEIALEFGNLNQATSIFKFCQEHLPAMVDNLNENLVKRYITNLIEAGTSSSPDEIYAAILFLNSELKQSEAAEEVARLAASENLSDFLTTAQRQALNNLFSHSSKWVML